MLPSDRRERALLIAARLLAHLPDAIKIRLSGEPPVVVDGQTLDPQLQLLRAAMHGRRPPGLIEPTVAAGRERYRHQTQAFRGPMTPVGDVHDLEIAGAAGPLRARHYVPPSDAESAALPLTVYLHGGGFVIGDLDTHDEPCRMLCRHAGVHVLSVAYRLAPEHPFPAAVEDAQAAFAWAVRLAASLGATGDRVAIGGDSAGGNLSAVVSAACRAAGPAAQLLIYPATDVGSPRPSRDLFAARFSITRADLDAFLECYIGSRPGTPLSDPRLSPLLAPGFDHIPPTLVAVAGFDPLRDEGDAYAAALERSGACVRHVRFPSLGHGFIHMTGVAPAARRAMIDISRAWRTLLGNV
jgi:acetyl esterase/lipase